MSFLPGTANVVDGNGPIEAYTLNYKFNLIDFDWVTWHNYEWENWMQVDALLNVAIGFLDLKGIWKSGTVYAVGDTVIDPRDLVSLYQATQSFTSTTDVSELDDVTFWDLRNEVRPSVSTVFGRQGDVVATEADYSAFYPLIADLDNVNANFDNYLPLAGGTVTGLLRINDTAPRLALYETGGTVNQRLTYVTTFGGDLQFQSRNDNGTFAGTFGQLRRDFAGGVQAANDILVASMGDARYERRDLTFATEAAFISADLSSISAGTQAYVGTRRWIKVTGATEFAKVGWEPVDFDTVADMKLSLRVLPEGSFVTADKWEYRAEPLVFANPHIINAGGTRFSLRSPVVDVEAFDADNTGVIDSTDQWEIAVAWAIAQRLLLRSGGEYKLSRTFAPNSRLQWMCNETTMYFQTATDINLVEALHYPITHPGGGLQPSGKRVLFDLKGMEGSRIYGALNIIGYQMSNAQWETRQNIKQHWIGLTASQGLAGAITFDDVLVQGCGYGMWQGDQRGKTAIQTPNLPYTRCSFRRFETRFCYVPIEYGSSGNGGDDVVFGQLRFSASLGRSRIIASELSFQNWFLSGLLNGRDEEPGITATLTAGSDTVTFSTTHVGLGVGRTVAFMSGGLNNVGASIPVVAKIIEEITPTQYRFDKTIEASGSGVLFMLDPPSVLLFGCNIPKGLVYVEYIHDCALVMDDRCSFEGVLRVSNGSMAGYYDSVALIYGDGVTFKATLGSETYLNSTCKRIVAVAHRTAPPSSTELNDIIVDINVNKSKVLQSVNLRPIELVELNNADRAGRTNFEDAVNSKMTLKYRCGEEVIRMRNYITQSVDEDNIMYEDETPSQRFTLLGSIVDGIYSGNVSAYVAPATYPIKTPGIAGGASMDGIIAGKRYYVELQLDPNPNDGDAFVCEAYLQYRLGGFTNLGRTWRMPAAPFRLRDTFVAPTDANRLHLFCLTDDSFLIRKFNVYEVITL